MSCEVDMEIGNKENMIRDYQKMEDLPVQLKVVMNTYIDRMHQEDEKYKKQETENQKTLERKKEGITKQKEEGYKEADLAKKNIVTQVDKLKKDFDLVKTNFGGLKGDTFKGSLKKAYDKIIQREADFEGSANMSFSKIHKHCNAIYDSMINKTDKNYDAQIRVATDEYYVQKEIEDERLKDAQKNIFEETKSGIQRLNVAEIRTIYEKLKLNIPSETNFIAAESIPETMEMGYLYIPFTRWGKNEEGNEVVELIRENFSYALVDENGYKCLELPFGRAFEQKEFNKIILHDEASRNNALDYIRALEMRMFMSIPCGKLRVTMIDPVDLGSNFSMFSCLGDDDERIISTRIWSDAKRIKEQLNLLIGQIEHVNQDCLRNEYDNIVVYNKHVGKNAEPLQALFIADFPRHFDQEACEMLEKIISSGPKCGIYTFITGNQQDVDECRFDLSGIYQGMEQMHYRQGILSYENQNMSLDVLPFNLPGKEEQGKILEVLKNGIKTSDRIIINFDEISDEITKHPEKWFQFSDENGLDIPIGLEGAARTVQIHLGGELVTQHHTLISGTIGSGKSTLLHTLIMSILLRYSPEDVQIYLLDFKRGVEFKVYAESRLPNFRVISLDTEPEFGLAVLKYLEQEQAERAQEFHDKNCDNIEKYNEIADSDPYNEVEKLPRIVVIIDEFHEMFSKSESAIAKECEMLLEQIIRQGRALGIHVILASQTLPDNLARIYGQIMNRVALQSTVTSAQYILDADNEAVNTLVNVDPGKGIFNDGGGNRDANHPFRVAYFTDQEQRELLRKIRERQTAVLGQIHMEKPRLLLSTIQDDNENPLNQFVQNGQIPKKWELGCPLYLGEEIAMVNEFDIRLKSRRRQNLLIMGNDYKRASLLYGFSAMSILFHEFCQSETGSLPNDPVITYFDFGKSTQSIHSNRNSLDIMSELSARFPFAIRVFGKNSLMDGIEILKQEYEDQNRTQKRHYVIFAGLNRARRLLDTDSAYSISPKQIFSELVKNGPEAGYNYIVWANEPSGFCNFYDDILTEFDYRLVYNLQEAEYEHVIKSTEMDTEYGNNNVISYNPDEDNKKIRVYSMPLAGWLQTFMNRIEGKEMEGNLLDNEFDQNLETEGEFGEYSEFGDEF